MKKQTNSTIKAHLIRGTFYLLLLIVICAIPFALAQSRGRGTAKRSVDKPNPAGPSVTVATGVPDSAVARSAATGAKSRTNLLTPKVPQVVLYDQYDNDLDIGIVSANRTDDPTLSAEAADNFAVPGGQTWVVTEVDIRSPVNFPSPTSFDVNFYLDNGSGLPGMQVYTLGGIPVVGNPDYIIMLTIPAVLTSGTYWVSAVGTITGTNWYWEGRSVTSNTYSTAWRNPGDGYGTGCTDWAVLTNCIGLNWPDQMFRLVGGIAGGTPSPTPTASPTPTSTPTATPCTGQYEIAEIGGSIEPGTTDVGIHCDDCVMNVTLPFSYTLYDQTFTSVNLSSNGNAQFVTTAADYVNVCLPWLDHDYTIFPYWDDLYLVNGGYGIFTSVTGSAPNRIFNIEWRAQYYPGVDTANFELRLYEGQTRFDVIYGQVDNGNTSATAGAQQNNMNFTQYFCDGSGGAAAGGQSYTLVSCPSPTPTASPSATATATATATPVATATATPTPTPTGTPGQCVYGLGYWKNHAEAWPVTELQLGNVTYTQEQLLAILRQPVRGNGLVLLAHQLIPALLNIANGADASCIQQTIDEANALIGDLVIPPVGDGYLAPRDVSALAGMLEQYNEGMLCAPSCEGGNTTPTPTPRFRPRPAPRPAP